MVGNKIAVTVTAITILITEKVLNPSIGTNFFKNHLNTEVTDMKTIILPKVNKINPTGFSFKLAT